MKQAYRNFLRNRRVTVISATAVLAMTFFLMAFANSIRLNRLSLDDAYDHLEVRAHIVSANMLVEPALDQERYQAILDSGFVKTYFSAAGFKQRGKTVLRGVSQPSADPFLEEVLSFCTWMDGYDAGLFQQAEAVCVVSANSGLELGDLQECFLEDKENLLQMKIVGVYDIPDAGDISTIFCSLPWLEHACLEQDVPMKYCELDMELTNLRKLEVFKMQMRELGMDSGSTHLVINDALLREVTSQLNRQIRLLESVLPILLALVAGIGFGLSYLLLRGRKREGAVMRSLGMKRTQVFSVLLIENLLQAILGSLLGCVCVAAVLGADAMQFHYAVFLIGCYLLGGSLAVWQLSGVNVFTVMTAKD